MRIHIKSWLALSGIGRWTSLSLLSTNNRTTHRKCLITYRQPVVRTRHEKPPNACPQTYMHHEPTYGISVRSPPLATMEQSWAASGRDLSKLFLRISRFLFVSGLFSQVFFLLLLCFLTRRGTRDRDEKRRMPLSAICGYICWNTCKVGNLGDYSTRNTRNAPACDYGSLIRRGLYSTLPRHAWDRTASAHWEAGPSWPISRTFFCGSTRTYLSSSFLNSSLYRPSYFLSSLSTWNSRTLQHVEMLMDCMHQRLPRS